MITKDDLLEAIAECRGVKQPTVNTCLKLAAFYTILDHMCDNAEDNPEMMLSTSAIPATIEAESKFVQVDSKSDFAQRISGMDSVVAWKIMDELMTMVQVIEPKLYSAVIRKIQDSK